MANTSVVKTIHFNTGRKYSVDGQRITATLYSDDTVTFYDHDRMIAGEFNLFFPELFNKKDILDMYDSRAFKNTTKAWKDGMTREGNNSKYNGN